MTTLTLPASVHPDVLIAGGHTYVALPLPTGLTIYRISQPGDIAPWQVFHVGDWPRFFAHSSGIFCAYRLSSDNTLAVADIATGELALTGIALVGNSPICWRNDGLLCCQVLPPDSPIVVWSAVWPALPAPPAIRQGVGTGLAQWFDTLWTWDEMNYSDTSVQSQAVYLKTPPESTLSVGQAPQGGILVDMNQTLGVLAPGTNCNDPRPALEPDGSLSIVHWVQGSHGSVETVLYQGVTAADLVRPAPPRPVIHPPTPLNHPAIFCAFLASGVTDRPSWANSHIMKDGTEMMGADGQRWNVRLLEAGTGSTAHPCIYVGSPEQILALPASLDNRYDVLSPWIYREANETDTAYLNRALDIISRVMQRFRVTPIAPIWNATTRIGPNGPLLTEQAALDSLTIGSSFGLPALIFEAGRAGFVPEAAQLLTQWRNGQPCPAPPMQLGLAARKLLLCR